MNQLQVVSISHRTANINHIGKYIPCFNHDNARLAQVLHQIKADLGISEVLYLTTCNRLTFVLVRPQVIDQDSLKKLFAYLHPEANDEFFAELSDVTTLLNGEEAIRHIFELAASLDSLVVGEREILRQLREAYDFCNAQSLSGDTLRVLMNVAVTAAKEVYTHTKIGENSVSVVSLAMQRMMYFHPSKNARFLIIGAGQTNHLVAKFLLNHGFKHFTVFNRSFDNAKILANKLNGKAYPLAELPQYREEFDIIITCTSAPEPVVTEKLYKDLLQGNPHSPKIIIDLAVPGNVERSITQNFSVKYIEVEQLRALAAQNLAMRQQEVVKAKRILERHIETGKANLIQRKMERAMASIPEQVKEIKHRALHQVFKKEIALLDISAQETIERIMEYVERKYIGIPMSVARKISHDLVAEME